MSTTRSLRRLRTRRLSRRTFLAASARAGVGSAGLALVGCGDDDDDDESVADTVADQTDQQEQAEETPEPQAEEQTQAQQTPEPEDEQATPAPSGTPTPTGQISMALVTLAAQQTDPHTQNAGNNYPFIESVFEQFQRRDARDGALIPALAESLEEPDEETMIFSMRPNALFWDGTPVTAHDAAWSLERRWGLDPEPAGVATEKANYGVPEVVDDLTLIAPLLEEGRALRWRGSIIGPRGWNIASRAYWDQVGEDEFSVRPMATGPFKLVDVEVQNFTAIEANELHYERIPFVKNIDMFVVPEQATRVARLQTGEAAFADGILGAPYENLQNDGELTIWNTEATAQTAIFYHSYDQEPFTDLRFRQALKLAVDQEALIEGVLGVGAPSPGVQIFPVTPGYSPEAFPPQEFDPEAAAQLISNAGLENVEIDLSGYDSSSTPLIPEMLEAVVDMWRDIGVTANLEIREAGAYFGSWRARELSGMAALSTPSWFLPVSLLNTHFISDGPYAGTVDPELDRLIGIARAELSEEGQAEAARAAFQYADEQAWQISLPWITSAWATRNDAISAWDPPAGSPYPVHFWTLRGEATA